MTDDDDGLEDAADFDGGGERIESFGVEIFARLVGVNGDLGEGEVGELRELFVFEGGGVKFFIDKVGGDEAGEVAAEAFGGGHG